jgi:uncharacterized protein YyaL (SSP411 family)
MLKQLLKVLIVGVICVFRLTQANENPVVWNNWGDEVFARAKAENRFVLLDLAAGWCHWCHVMEETTYRDPAVAKLLGEHYVPVHADQDAHPDLANRYEDYGWPATVVLAADGTEIVKRRGYIPPAQFAALLQAVVDDPTPGPSVVDSKPVDATAASTIDPKLAKQVSDDYFALYDQQYGGWGTEQKFIDADSIEYALRGAVKGDKKLAAMAKQTLDAGMSLIDPVWGGVYQYSIGPTWNDPHFEKIISFQANYLRAYSYAYGIWHDERYLHAAQSITHYLTTWLHADNGAFYVSQDADVDEKLTGHRFYALSDSERRAGAAPPVDRHIYARENGWAIAALAVYASATGDTAVLDDARKAARYIKAHHRLSDGSYTHAEIADGGDASLHLGDNIAMTQALLALYSTTGEREWLQQARATAGIVKAIFTDERGGYFTAPVNDRAIGVFKTTVRQIDENIAVARTANLLFHYTGDAQFKQMTDHALRYLTAPALVESRRLLPGVLLAAEESNSEPLHITIVGDKSDAGARGLYAQGTAWPIFYKRVEWWDRNEGPLPNPDVQYPMLSKVAAFLCSNDTCSSPMFSPEVLSKRLQAFAVE